MDNEKGNAKGIGGPEGVFEAIGSPMPLLETRSFSGELQGLTAVLG